MMSPEDRKSLALLLECMIPTAIRTWPNAIKLGFEGNPNAAFVDARDEAEILNEVNLWQGSYLYQDLVISPHLQRLDAGPSMIVSALYVEFNEPASAVVERLNQFFLPPTCAWGTSKHVTAIWPIEPVNLIKSGGKIASDADDIQECLTTLAGLLNGRQSGHVRPNPQSQGYQPTFGAFLRQELVMPYSYRGKDPRNNLPELVTPFLLPVLPIKRLEFSEIVEALSTPARMFN